MENPKKKDSLPSQILEELGDSLATAAQTLHQASHTILKPEEQVAEMNLRTSHHYAEPATPSFTPLEFERSLESMENESTDEEESVDCVIFQSIFKNVEKDEDGGYTISFQIPETDSVELAKLICRGRLAHCLVLTPHTP